MRICKKELIIADNNEFSGAKAMFLSSSIPLCKLQIILSAKFDDIYILGVENHSV